MAYPETIHRIPKTDRQFIEAGSFEACSFFIELGFKQNLLLFFPTHTSTTVSAVEPKILPVHTVRSGQRPGYTVAWEDKLPVINFHYQWLKKHEAAALHNLGQSIEDVSFRAGIHAHLAVIQKYFPDEHLLTIPLAEYVLNSDRTDTPSLADAAFFIWKKLGY